MIETSIMNLLAIALGAIGVLLMAHSLSRQSLIRALARELRAIREREQELRIRFDDLSSKVNNSLTQVSKLTSMYDKRIANIEDGLSRKNPQEKLFQLESEVDQEMRDRLLRLEQLAVSGATPSATEGDSKAATASETPSAAPTQDSTPSAPAVSVPLSTVMQPWNSSIRKDFVTISALKDAPAKKIIEALQKALRTHHMESLIDSAFEEQLSHALVSKNGNGSAHGLDQALLSESLSRALQEHLKPAHMFSCKSAEIDQKLRTLLMVGPKNAGKTAQCVSIARMLQREGAKVLLADCTGGSERDGVSLASHHRAGDLEVVAPLINTKPHHVAYKAIHRAQDEHFEIVLLDTPPALSGRNKVSPEVTSIAGMIAREHPHPPHETVLILDASNPKEAITQGKCLLAAGAFSGLALTHLDALPHPGAVLEIVSALNMPLWFVSYGPSEREFCRFDSAQYSKLLFGLADVTKEPEPSRAESKSDESAGQSFS